ncbi:MAG TPA: cytochrome c5 family protein, partial [Polyangia bacterium]|nr:cytochrome c5 family protein [Polyangia bacterium]
MDIDGRAASLAQTAPARMSPSPAAPPDQKGHQGAGEEPGRARRLAAAAHRAAAPAGAASVAAAGTAGASAR